MALVSPSPPPPASLYPAAQPLFARASGEPPVAALRSTTLSAASSPPSTAARPAGAMHESAHLHAGSAGSGPAHSQSRGQLAAGSPNVRPLPSPQPARARTTSAPFPDAATAPHLQQQQQQHASAAAGTGAADLPPPVLVPSRSSSTPPSSGSLSRPSPAPTPSTRTSSSSLRSASHAHSASNSSSNSPSSSTFALPPVPGVPRLAPAHFAAGASSPSLTSSPQSYLPQQQQQHHAQQLHVAQVAAHPTFAGQPFPPFAPAYPHPAYPFIPSPHPNGPNGVMGFPAGGAFGPGGANTLQLNAEQQKRMQQYQHQWQMEVLKSQQQQQQQQQVQGDGQRRRATSGPAPSHTGSYYTTPVGYPAMPSPSHQQLPFGMTSPSLPPGTMLPQFNVHGYPTPPGSLDGARSNGGGAESSSSSGGSAPSRAEAFHPYRRGGDDRRHGHGHGERSTSAHRSAGSGSAAGAAGRRTPTHLQQHSRGESIASLASQHMYAPQDLPAPALPRSGSSSSVNSAARTSGSSSPSGSARHVSLPSTSSSSSASSLSRQRTESQNSSSSSVHQQQLHQRPPSSLRGASFDSARSATPVQANIRGARPSPLAAPQVTDESEDDDGAESDGTAEATATISTGLVASPTITSIASTATATTAAAGATPKGKEKEKEKEKKGMKSRFKKAFGVSNSSSSTTLSEFDVDGRGPKQLAAGPNGAFRPRRDSSSSSETASTTAPRTPPAHGGVGAVPYATHQQHPSVASSAASVLGDGMSTTTGGANGKKPPSSRFRLLNNKFNGSSDNLSISSTVSSASVMIRKLGQMGKLARRNSLMGLTKAFKKDKNKDGAADDSGFEASSSAASFAGVAPTSKLSKKDKKKGFAADASVSHATAEYDSSAFSSSNGVPNGMSPAAALARRQQQQYAEQEAAEERARQAAAEEAARLGPPLRSFEQLPAHVRADSAGSDVSSVKSGKNGAGKAGKKWRLGFGGSKTDLHETSSLSSDATAVERGASALGQYEDATPRQSLEVLAPQQQGAYQTYGANYVERDSSQEYEPSLYREGATPKPISAKAVRGILKGAATYRQEDFVAPRAPFARTRASSFDAPQQQARPGSPGGAALVNVIPSEQQVDGVGPMATSPRADTHPPTHIDEVHDNAAARIHPDASSSAGGVYTHPSMNASAPALNHFTSSPSMRPTPPGTAASRRRITFASNLSVHTTWPAAIYDRRAEPATCNRLTPLLAQQIKEELNSFKMEEMDVHPLSRKLTHFFV